MSSNRPPEGPSEATSHPAALRIGYLVPSRDATAAGRDDPRPLVELAERAERLGFDSVWVGDSPLARPRADAVALLSAIAARTRRVALGTAVLLPALRNTVLLAHQLATVDALSGGRLIVGVGSGFPYGPTARQFAAAGADYARRVAATDEAVAALRVLWGAHGRPASFAGDLVRFDHVAIAPPPASPGGPPIWMAGAGAAAERRVGRLADGWLPYPPDPARYAAGVRRVAGAATAAGRRPPTPALYATVAVERDGVGVASRLRASVERSYDAPLEALSKIQALHAGSPEAIVEWLGRYVRAGARHIVLRVADDEPEAALELIGRTVLPALHRRRQEPS